MKWTVRIQNISVWQRGIPLISTAIVLPYNSSSWFKIVSYWMGHSSVKKPFCSLGTPNIRSSSCITALERSHSHNCYSHNPRVVFVIISKIYFHKIMFLLSNTYIESYFYCFIFSSLKYNEIIILLCNFKWNHDFTIILLCIILWNLWFFLFLFFKKYLLKKY